MGRQKESHRLAGRGVGGSQAPKAPGFRSCQGRRAWPSEPREAVRTEAWKQRAQVCFRSLVYAVYGMVGTRKSLWGSHGRCPGKRWHQPGPGQVSELDSASPGVTHTHASGVLRAGLRKCKATRCCGHAHRPLLYPRTPGILSPRPLASQAHSACQAAHCFFVGLLGSQLASPWRELQPIRMHSPPCSY